MLLFTIVCGPVLLKLVMHSTLDLQIGYCSDLVWVSSIVLSLIKCQSWKSTYKPQASAIFQRTYSLQGRIIKLSHWPFLFEAPHFTSSTCSSERVGQEPHWSQSRRWLYLVQSPLAQNVLRSMGDSSSPLCPCLSTSHNTRPFIMGLNVNTECKGTIRVNNQQS